MTDRQAFWQQVAAGLPPVPTAQERWEADIAKGFYKQSFIYFAAEAAELRARLDAITNGAEIVASQ